MRHLLALAILLLPSVASAVQVVVTDKAREIDNATHLELRTWAQGLWPDLSLLTTRKVLCEVATQCADSDCDPAEVTNGANVWIHTDETLTAAELASDEYRHRTTSEVYAADYSTADVVLVTGPEFVSGSDYTTMVGLANDVLGILPGTLKTITLERRVFDEEEIVEGGLDYTYTVTRKRIVDVTAAERAACRAAKTCVDA